MAPWPALPPPPTPTFRTRSFWRVSRQEATMEKLSRTVHFIGQRRWAQTREFLPVPAARAASGWRRRGENSKVFVRYAPKACGDKPKGSACFPSVVARRPLSFRLLEVENVGSCKVQMPLPTRRWCKKHQPTQMRRPRCPLYLFSMSICNTFHRSAGPETASKAENIYCNPFKWPTSLGKPFQTPRVCQYFPS